MKNIIGSYELYNGVKIPVIGFGTWQIPEGEEVISSVSEAIKCGYTHIDTASAYYNETGVGEAIRKCGIPREELFITTKLWNTEQGYESTLDSFEQSMGRLGLDYLDLFLIHWPVTYIFENEYPKRMKDTWRAFEELYRAKKVRAIGVSNFLIHHIETLMEDATILPMVNQLEIHPGYNQKEIVKYCFGRGIVVESWSPLACGRIFEDSDMKKIVEKYEKSVAQVVLRWHLQNNLLPLPKSTKAERIAENINIFDFELEEKDVAFINDLPERYFSGYHPDNVSFLKEIG
jgi:diketogulonate reductase-like aldo/keto reductase